MKMISVIAAAVALGLAWSGVAIPQTTEKAKETTRDAAEETKDKAETIKDKISDKAETAKDKLKSAGEKVKDKAVEVKDKAKSAMRRDGKAPATTSSESVRMAQETLKTKGFDPGPADGVMGPKTEAAIKDFQRKQGLKVTGRLDLATRSQLGDTGQAGSTSPSASPSTAATEGKTKQQP